MRLVIKVGGSLAISKDGPKVTYFKKLIPVLKEIDSKNKMIVSIGGGKFLRKYYKDIQKLNLSHEEMEWIAIELLRVNVRFLSLLIGKKSIYTLGQIKNDTEGVIGGIRPGRSTDANAAYAAKRIGADYFIKLTNVRGIYDKDPKRYKNAKLLRHIKFSELRHYQQNDNKPGKYGVLDKMAIDIITKNKIKTVVMSGRNPEDIFKVLNGEKIGTVIGD